MFQLMKNVISACFVCCLVAGTAQTVQAESNFVFNPNQKLDRPVAKIVEVKKDFDVYKNGQKGMRIHLKVAVEQGKGKKQQLRIYVLDFDKKDQPLQTPDKKWTDSEGRLRYTATFTPKTNNSTIEGSMFIPYSSLKSAVLAKGPHQPVYRLTLWINVWSEKEGKYIAQQVNLQPVDYKFPKPANEKQSSKKDDLNKDGFDQ